MLHPKFCEKDKGGAQTGGRVGKKKAVADKEFQTNLNAGGRDPSNWQGRLGCAETAN